MGATRDAPTAGEDGSTEGAPTATAASREGGPEAAAFVAPATLTAIAEAGVLYLPLELIARSTALHPSGGPLAWYPLFLALFAGGVALATRFRAWPGTPYAVAASSAAVGVVQSVVWNEGAGPGAFVAITLCLLAGVRVATLALRDWRDPVDASFGWGAGALLTEVAFARAVGWGNIVWPIAALYFLGSLGSRAASVRLVERAVQGEAAGPDSARRWRLVAGGLAATAAVLTGLGLALGTQRGPVETLARWLVQLFATLLYFAAYAVAFVMSWLLSLVGVDRKGIQDWVRRLGNRLRSPTTGRGLEDAHIPLWERAIGVVVLFALIGGLVYLVVRQRRKANAPKDGTVRWAEASDDTEGIFARASEARRRRKHRHEPPEDAVRRLYAEALDELEERGRPRSPSATPGEYLRTVRADVPEASAGMGVLTRAYEDVRYGRMVLDRAAVDSLEAEWISLRKAIRAAPPPDADAERDDAAATAAHLAERAEGAAGTAPSSDETFGRR